MSYPSLIEIITVGKSTEGKSLRVAKISSNSARKDMKQAIWIDGGNMTNLYLI